MVGQGEEGVGGWGVKRQAVASCRKSGLLWLELLFCGFFPNPMVGNMLASCIQDLAILKHAACVTDRHMM